jgi:hypothetical protein
VLAALGTVSGFGQWPLHKQVNYTINVPYSLRKADYMLPAGNYILHQINANDLNLFALYQGSMMHPPIAMIRTVRIDYAATGYPETTDMWITYDESSPDAHPVLRGWHVPGDDGWEIIGVVPRHARESAQPGHAHSGMKSRFRHAVGHLNPKHWVPHRHKNRKASLKCCAQSE